MVSGFTVQKLYPSSFEWSLFHKNRATREKEKIWLSSMTKDPTPKEKSKKQRDNTKTPPKRRLQNDCGLT